MNPNQRHTLNLALTGAILNHDQPTAERLAHNIGHHDAADWPVVGARPDTVTYYAQRAYDRAAAFAHNASPDNSTIPKAHATYHLLQTLEHHANHTTTAT